MTIRFSLLSRLLSPRHRVQKTGVTSVSVSLFLLNLFACMKTLRVSSNFLIFFLYDSPTGESTVDMWCVISWISCTVSNVGLCTPYFLTQHNTTVFHPLDRIGTTRKVGLTGLSLLEFWPGLTLYTSLDNFLIQEVSLSVWLALTLFS